MRNVIRTPLVVVSSVAVAMLAACAGPNYPAYSSYPTSTYPVATYPVAGIEYGRVTNIEYMPVGSNVSTNSVIGAVVGGLLGAGVGSTIGAGVGRTAATVLGGVAGAAVGSHLARNQAGALTQPGYRITMQSDNGGMRTFEVPATGDLHVGDRVRVDNGVIYRA